MLTLVRNTGVETIQRRHERNERTMSKQDDSWQTFAGIAFILFLIWALCNKGPASHWEIEDYESWGPPIRDR